MPSSTEAATSKPQVVILCGGYGMRMREYPDLIPKPMVPIGNKPILWHIMKSYAQRGFDEFILCLGYRSDAIRHYFLNFGVLAHDVTVELKDGGARVLESAVDGKAPWKVTLVDTGIDTMTGGRIRRALPFVRSDTVFIAYGDCLSDIDFGKQLEFHLRHRGEMTVTGINQRSRYGHIEMGEGGRVAQFEEKPVLNDVVSGGFFVAKREFITRIDGDEISLESQPLQRVARDGKLYCYHHRGFWACMDTYRDYEELNSLYARKDAPWVSWKI